MHLSFNQIRPNGENSALQTIFCFSGKQITHFHVECISTKSIKYLPIKYSHRHTQSAMYYMQIFDEILAMANT